MKKKYNIKRINLNLIPQSLQQEDSVNSIQIWVKNLGLNCSHTRYDNLSTHVSDVISEIRKTHNRKKNREVFKACSFDHKTKEYRLISGLAEWREQDSAGGYSDKLVSIIDPKNFNILNKREFPVFVGQSSTLIKNIKGNDALEAIKKTFVALGSTLCIDYLHDMKMETITSVLNEIVRVDVQDVIDKLKEKPYTYESKKILRIMFVDEYDVKSGTCEGFGGVNLKLHMVIKDVGTSKNDFDVQLTASGDFVKYSDPDTLERDYDYLRDFN